MKSMVLLGLATLTLFVSCGSDSPEPISSPDTLASSSTDSPLIPAENTAFPASLYTDTIIALRDAAKEGCKQTAYTETYGSETWAYCSIEDQAESIRIERVEENEKITEQFILRDGELVYYSKWGQYPASGEDATYYQDEWIVRGDSIGIYESLGHSGDEESAEKEIPQRWESHQAHYLKIREAASQ